MNRREFFEKAKKVVRAEDLSKIKSAYWLSKAAHRLQKLKIIIFWMMIHILLSHCSMIVLKIAFYPRYYFLDYLMNILQVQLKCYPK